MALSKMNVPYKNFKNGDIISPSEWNSNLQSIENITNSNVDSLTKSSSQSLSGASSIGYFPEQGLTSNNVQNALSELQKNINDKIITTQGVTEDVIRNQIIPSYDFATNSELNSRVSSRASEEELNAVSGRVSVIEEYHRDYPKQDVLPESQITFLNGIDSNIKGIKYGTVLPETVTNGQIFILITNE